MTKCLHDCLYLWMPVAGENIFGMSRPTLFVLVHPPDIPKGDESILGHRGQLVFIMWTELNITNAFDIGRYVE